MMSDWKANSSSCVHDHISRTESSCFFHLRLLCQLRGVVCRSTMQQPVSALVWSSLDDCNAVLSGLPSTTLIPLRRVLNAAIRLVANLGPRDHMSIQMKELHLLPMKYRINFILCLMMHAAVTGPCPQYILDIVHPLSTLLGRKRLSSSCEWRVRHPQDKNFFRWKSFLRGWSTLVEHSSTRHYRQHKPRSF